MTDPANIALSDCAEDVWLAGSPVELLIKTQDRNPLDGVSGLKAMDARGVKAPYCSKEKHWRSLVGR